MEELVEQYYNKFMKFFVDEESYKYFNPEAFDKLRKEIKVELTEIVKNNRDYLLRDSFIDYMTENCGYLICEMKRLYNGDNKNLLDVVFWYLEKAIFRPHSIDPRVKNYDFYVDILEEDLKDLCEKTYKAVCCLDKEYNFDENDFWLLRGSLITLFARFYINNELDKYEKAMNTFIDDPHYILDDLALNNYKVVYGEDETPIHDRVYDIIKDKQEKQSIK